MSTALGVVALLLALAAGAASARRARRGQGRSRRFWRMTSAAAWVWAGGGALPLLPLDASAPASVVAAVSAAGTASVLAWAVFYTLAITSYTLPDYTRRVLARDALDSAVLGLTLLLVLWVLVVVPVGGQGNPLRDLSAPLVALAVAVLTAVTSAVNASVSVLVRSSQRGAHLWASAAGAVVVAAGSLTSLRGTVVAGAPTESSSTASALLWALGWAVVLLSTRRGRRTGLRTAPEAGLLGGSAMAATSAAVVVVVTVWQTAADRSGPDPVSAALSTAALAAVVCRALLDLRRMGRLQRHLERRVEERTRELADSRRRFAALVSQSSDPVLVLDAGGRVVDANPATAELLGLPPGPALDLLASDQLRAAFQALVASGADHLEVRLALQHADGHRVDLDAVLTDLLDDPDVRGVVLNGRDVTTALRLERELSERAFNDALTGLPNRALFRDRLEHALRARASRAPVKLLYLDLDGFKAVNDSLGHDAGDELLVAVAQRLREVVREADTVARLGGDEFAVLLEEGALLDDAERLARRICDAVRQPATVRGVEVRVAASVGLASSRVAGHDAEALMRSADLAMYQAKAAGRGGHAVYEPSMHEALVERVQMEADLRRAVDQGEFRVVYQPLVDMGTGGVSGVEALVRWHHPEHGVVVPADFIPLAESTGLIDAIGAFVLREACQQVATWRAEVPGAEQMRLSVNLSGHQLRDPGLVSAVVEALGASELPATSLVLEVTESVFVGQDDAALEVLEALRALGVRLAIDDFGTGYSSLSYLHRLPVDIIKIDKSFVDRLSDAGDLSLVDAIVGMADVLGLATVAEGVEHEHQRAALAAQGCTTGQGYHFSPPVEPHLLPELVVGALPARAVPVPELASEPALEPVGGSAGA